MGRSISRLIETAESRCSSEDGQLGINLYQQLLERRTAASNSGSIRTSFVCIGSRQTIVFAFSPAPSWPHDRYTHWVISQQITSASFFLQPFPVLSYSTYRFLTLLRFPSLRHLGKSGWRQDSGFTRQGKLVKSGMGGKRRETGWIGWREDGKGRERNDRRRRRRELAYEKRFSRPILIAWERSVTEIKHIPYFLRLDPDFFFTNRHFDMVLIWLLFLPPTCSACCK